MPIPENLYALKGAILITNELFGRDPGEEAKLVPDYQHRKHTFRHKHAPSLKIVELSQDETRALVLIGLLQDALCNISESSYYNRQGVIALERRFGLDGSPPCLDYNLIGNLLCKKGRTVQQQATYAFRHLTSLQNSYKLRLFFLENSTP